VQHITSMLRENRTMKNNDIILMAHGGGGQMTGSLIKDVIVSELGNPILNMMDDAACLDIEERDVVMTTDSYVVDPIFFPGGDIGMIAACGTINDLAMQGARPLYMSLALILQEGLSVDDLKKVVKSLKVVCDDAGVSIVTGDTKVVERSKEQSGLFINTTGIGVKVEGVDVSASNARPGDLVIVTGTIGDHGMAIMNVREGLDIRSGLVSDAAPLWGLIKCVFDVTTNIHCLRDPTRGGVAAALCDISKKSGFSIRLKEASLPVRAEVRGACDILGMEPLNVANEGKAIVICAADERERVLNALQMHPLGKDACVIGEVCEATEGIVTLQTSVGGERIVDIPVGEDLPRIC
jgi:hydrogenase expression/formation protein HypE